MPIVIEIMDRKCPLRPKDQIDTLATMSTAARVSNEMSFRPRVPLYQVYSNTYTDISNTSRVDGWKNDISHHLFHIITVHIRNRNIDNSDSIDNSFLCYCN